MRSRMAARFCALLLTAAVVLSGCGGVQGGGDPDSGAGLPVSESSVSSVREMDDSSAGSLSTGVDEDGVYDSRDEVALYLHLYDHLPENYMTKSEARKLGWSGGSLEKYAEGMCIGGDRYGNYEGNLPKEDTYHECDIDTLGAKSRGAKRIVYSQDGDIYYTEDHYETFTQLYDGDGGL